MVESYEDLKFWWKLHGNKIFFGIIIVGSILIGRNLIINARKQAHENSAEQFDSLSLAFNSYKKSANLPYDKKNIKIDRDKALQQVLGAQRVLQQSDSSAYKEVASIYQMLTQINKSQLETTVSDFKPSGLPNSLAPEFFSELKTYVAAKMLLNSPKNKTGYQQALKALKLLSEKGSVFTLPAARLLFANAKTPESLEDAKKILKLVGTRQPWLRDLADNVVGAN
jgi:hypothetical protein